MFIKYKIKSEFIFILLLFLMIFVYIFPLFHRVISTDETVAYLYSNSDFLGFFSSMLKVEVHPFLFFLFQRFSFKLLGRCILAIRIIPFIFSILTLCIIYIWIKREFSYKHALLTVLFFILNPFFMRMATDGRMYMQLLLGSLFSWYILIYYEKYRLFYFISLLFLLFTHVNSIFVVMSQFFYSILYRRHLIKPILVSFFIFIIYSMFWHMSLLNRSFSEILSDNSWFFENINYRDIRIFLTFFLEDRAFLWNFFGENIIYMAIFLIFICIIFIFLKRKLFIMTFLLPFLMSILFYSGLYFLKNVNFFKAKRFIFFFPIIPIGLSIISFSLDGFKKKIFIILMLIIHMYFFTYSLKKEGLYSPYEDLYNIKNNEFFLKITNSLKPYFYFKKLPDILYMEERECEAFSYFPENFVARPLKSLKDGKNKMGLISLREEIQIFKRKGEKIFNAYKTGNYLESLLYVNIKKNKEFYNNFKKDFIFNTGFKCSNVILNDCDMKELDYYFIRRNIIKIKDLKTTDDIFLANGIFIYKEYSFLTQFLGESFFFIPVEVEYVIKDGDFFYKPLKLFILDEPLVKVMVFFLFILSLLLPIFYLINKILKRYRELPDRLFFAK